jgi:hypothetical protein
MTAPANSLKRVSTAKNRVPRLTGWGTRNFRRALKETTLAGRMWDRIRALIGAVRRTAPTITIVACSLFR